jgi:NAD(P)H dehydrogenase (quinone)
MKALIVFAHPEPDSFNGRMKSVAVETLAAMGHEAAVCDLYAEGFDPLEGPKHFPQRAAVERFNAQTEQHYAATHSAVSADVRAMIEKLDWAELLILQYPMWWYSVPAILKGWLDRVLVYGSIYTTEMRYDKGRFRGRRAMLSVTCGGPQGSYAENGRNGDVNLFIWPTNYTLYYVGYTVLPPFLAFGVMPPAAAAQEPQAKAHLTATEERYRQHLRTLDARSPLDFNKWGDWDSSGRFKPDVEIHNAFSRFAKAGHG